jgi:hypothetical protein
MVVRVRVRRFCVLAVTVLGLAAFGVGCYEDDLPRDASFFGPGGPPDAMPKDTGAMASPDTGPEEVDAATAADTGTSTATDSGATGDSG